MKKKSIIHLIHFLELASNDAKTFHEFIETRFTQIVVPFACTIAYLRNVVQFCYALKNKKKKSSNYNVS